MFIKEGRVFLAIHILSTKLNLFLAIRVILDHQAYQDFREKEDQKETLDLMDYQE